MSPLAWLQANSHYISFEINPQRSNYRTVAEELAVLDALEAIDAEDLQPDVRAECVKRDALVVVHVYKDTMVGFYSFYHYDADACIDLAQDALVGAT